MIPLNIPVARYMYVTFLVNYIFYGRAKVLSAV